MFWLKMIRPGVASTTRVWATPSTVMVRRTPMGQWGPMIWSL